MLRSPDKGLLSHGRRVDWVPRVGPSPMLVAALCIFTTCGGGYYSGRRTVRAQPKQCGWDTDCSFGYTCRKGTYAFTGVCANAFGQVEAADCTGHHECNGSNKCAKASGQWKGVCVDGAAYLAMTRDCESNFDCEMGEACSRGVCVSEHQLQERQARQEEAREDRLREHLKRVCSAALVRCSERCSSAWIEDEEGESRDNTDFDSECIEACSDGLDACTEADALRDACEEFEDTCSSECPSEVYDYDAGEYLWYTDSQDECERACAAGAFGC